MMELWNSWKNAAASVAQMGGQNRWGLVTSVRRSDTGYECRVRIQPEDIMTGWLPVTAHMVGSGWGFVSPPEPGMQAFVAPDSGDGHHGVVIGMAYSNAARPPVPASDFDQPDGTPVEPGEVALVSKSGGVIRLCSDGSIHIKGDVRIDGALTVMNSITAKTGDITAEQANVVAVQGDVIDQHNSLDRLREHYNIHVHGNSGGPNPLDPE